MRCFSFKRNGGTVLRKRLETLDEIGAKFDVIGNCSGLGARHLVNDTSVYPIRGQTIRVHAPHVKHFYVFGNDHYVLQKYLRHWIPLKKHVFTL